MKLAEMPRHEKADQQYANRKSKNVTYRAQVKVADARHKKVAGDGVEEAPKNVHCGRGQPLAGRLCEGRLKGLSHHAADIMRNGVGQKNSSKEVRHKMKPGHGYALLVASRLRMSWVEPVSPSRGKTLARLYSCASGRTSVMASRASVTLNPCSYACRAVASTPVPVAIPVTTTCVTPLAFSCASRSVLANAPHVRFVTTISPAWRSSSGIRSLNPSGNVEKRRGCSVRPGAPPATLTRTTGRSRRRKASSKAQVRSMTPA